MTYKNQILKWGILGTARIARKKMIEAIQSSEGNQCLAIASRSMERAKETAEVFNIPVYYDNYYKLINNSEIDAVYIPLPNSLHHQWVINAASKGKHILCEKPIATSVSQLKEMIQACKKHGVMLYEAHSYFLHPRFIKLFKLLNDDIIGHINLIQTNFSFTAQKEHAIRFQHELGGGSLFDIGCYGIDLINQLKKEKVNDVEAVFKMENKVDMEFLGILKYENNDEAIIRTSFLNDRCQTLLLVGEKGEIFLPDAYIPSGDMTTIFIESEKNTWLEEIENVNQYKLLIKEFREILVKNQDMDIQNKRYLNNMVILEKLIKIQQN